jgi:putative ABC transport system permease protein
VSADYADVVRLRLRAGRFITDRDTASGSHVAVVSESFAREAFGGEPVVGQYLVEPALPGRGQAGGADAITREVVGVVNDVILPFRSGLGAPATADDIYVPLARSATVRGRPFVDSPAVFVRTFGDDPSVARFLRELLGEIGPGALISTTSVTAMLSAQEVQPRFYATLAGIFGGVALLLAAFGLYSVLSHTVTQRRREIGLRMALGAGRHDVLLLVIKRGCALVGAGVFLGLLAAVATTRILESVLFGVTPADPLTFSVVAAVLLSVGLLACWLPARRAVGIDPLEALRQ